jgi:hypothetical protein
MKRGLLALVIGINGLAMSGCESLVGGGLGAGNTPIADDDDDAAAPGGGDDDDDAAALTSVKLTLFNLPEAFADLGTLRIRTVSNTTYDAALQLNPSKPEETLPIDVPVDAGAATLQITVYGSGICSANVGQTGLAEDRLFVGTIVAADLAAELTLDVTSDLFTDFSGGTAGFVSVISSTPAALTDANVVTLQTAAPVATATELPSGVSPLVAWEVTSGPIDSVTLGALTVKFDQSIEKVGRPSLALDCQIWAVGEVAPETVGDDPTYVRGTVYTGSASGSSVTYTDAVLGNIEATGGAAPVEDGQLVFTAVKVTSPVIDDFFAAAPTFGLAGGATPAYGVLLCDVTLLGVAPLRCTEGERPLSWTFAGSFTLP